MKLILALHEHDLGPALLGADFRAAVAGVVRRVDGSAEGWLVEECEPLVPPAVADGERTEALANYGSGGDEDEFQRRFAALMDSCARFGADQGLDLVPSSRYCFDLAEARLRL